MCKSPAFANTVKGRRVQRHNTIKGNKIKVPVAVRYLGIKLQATCQKISLVAGAAIEAYSRALTRVGALRVARPHKIRLAQTAATTMPLFSAMGSSPPAAQRVQARGVLAKTIWGKERCMRCPEIILVVHMQAENWTHTLGQLSD